MKFLKYLEEAYLLSDVSFGFELEAFRKKPNKDDFEKWSIKIDNYENIEGAAEDLIGKELSEFFPNGELKDDESVSGPMSAINFEWTSPVLKFTPENILKLKKFFLWFKNNENYNTNTSCGLHFHFSFPYISKEDGFWIICQLAIDKDAKKTFLYLKKIKFFNEYSQEEYLDYIEELIKEVDYKNDLKYFSSEILKNFNNEKYKVLRIHPQGTLEWRGPRNFLNKSKDIELINEFIEKLYIFVRTINKKLDEKDLNGLPKEKFYKILKGTKEKIIFSSNEKIKGTLTEDEYKKISQKWPLFNKLIIKSITVDKKTIDSDVLTIKNGKIWGNQKDVLENIRFKNVELNNIKCSSCFFESCNIKNSEMSYSKALRGIIQDSQIVNCDLKKLNEVNKSKILNCNCDSIFFEDCKIENGNFKECSFFRNQIEGGYFSDSEVRDSIWYSGLFNRGDFVDSEWKNGTWNFGNFILNDLQLEIYNTKFSPIEIKNKYDEFKQKNKKYKTLWGLSFAFKYWLEEQE